MSAAFEGKKQAGRQARQQKAEARTAREAKRKKEERRSNLMYILIAVLFVAVAVVTLVWKSNIFQKQATAATMNGKNYNAATVSYYYGAAYQSFMSQYGSYASLFGLDTSTPLDEQECSMVEDEEGGTWRDYFIEQGLHQMEQINALVDSADAEGFTYPSDLSQQVQENLDSLEKSVLAGGYSSLNQYFATAYGTLVTESLVKDEMLKALKADAYSQSYADSLTYTEDDLTAAYEEDRNTYDMVDYEYVKIDGAAESTTDDEGNTVDPTEEESEAAMEAAKATADAIYEEYQAGTALSDAADAYSEDGASYSSDEEGTYSSSVVMDWLFDESREAGDCELLEDESGSQYYVAVFNERYRPEFDTSDVRHILIGLADGELEEGDEGYEEEQEQLKADAEAKAEALLEEWKSGEATEDSFAALAEENSEDSGSASDGGLITGISKLSSYVENFLNWSIDDHEPGDTGIVESTYGYHIMYYVGKGNPYWMVQVEDDLQDEDYNTWYTEKTDGYTAEQQDGVKYVG